MNLDDLLLVGGFVFAGIALLVAILELRRPKKRLVIITALSSVLVVTSGMLLYRSHQHDALVDRVGKEIVAAVGDEALTFDELHGHLLFRSFPLVNEALFELINNGVIRHRLERLQIDGKQCGVRVYYRDRNARQRT